MEHKVFLVFFVNLKCRLQIPERKGGGVVKLPPAPVSMVTQKPITLMPVSQLIHVQSPLNP